MKEVEITQIIVKGPQNRKPTKKEDELICSICDKVFKVRRYKVDHMKRMHRALLFQCEKCGLRFGLKRLLNYHLFSTPCGFEHECDLCSERFQGLEDLQRHGAMHGGKGEEDPSMSRLKVEAGPGVTFDKKREMFFCDICHRSLVSSRALSLHKHSFHNGSKPFPCSLCPKSFTRRSELDAHKRTHTGERPFNCIICKTSFSQKPNLISHVRLKHLSEKRHICQTCGMTFARRRLLSYHQMSKHTGERPHKCQECGSKFVNPDHLRRHIKIHLGEKKFSCLVCTRKFRTKENLKEHCLIHSEKKPFECIRCGLGFTRKSHFSTHLQISGHDTNTVCK